ncbi:MAG: GntR family transcriptional regulator [Brucellaceae bacterium]|jgi:DNA-binding GntR family transcriptional regulator|nr:GntR family transcriptional regulator [Brucellaceae bacterium]
MSGPLTNSDDQQEITPAATALSLSDQAYRLLERHIVTLSLQPGSVTNERVLIELTGMGRTPVREAIQRLAWEGLMEVRPRSGIAITALDPKDFTKVLDAREGVEQILCRDAARYSGAYEHEKLREAAVMMKQAAVTQDIPLFLDADKAFDEVLGNASLNPYATRLAAPLQSHSRRFWFRLRRDNSLQDSSAAHTRMIEAIVSRDENLAIESAKQLIAHLRTLTP